MVPNRAKHMNCNVLYLKTKGNDAKATCFDLAQPGPIFIPRTPHSQ